MNRSSRWPLVSYVAFVILVAAVPVVFGIRRYGDRQLSPGMIGGFSATLIAFVIALWWERSKTKQEAGEAARRAAQQDSGAGYTGRSSEFRRLILPRLAGATSADLAHATGLSRGYCAQIRDGKRVPHVRHWAAFQLAGLQPHGCNG